MFLALRDLAHAKGRFALIGGVMALITLLVVMLTGLAAGLGRESVAAISTLGQRGVGQVAFTPPAQGQKVGFDSSRVESDDIAKAARVPGVEKASLLTIVPTRATVAGVPSAATVFVVPEGSFAAPAGVRRGSVVVGSGLTKDARVSVGDSILFGDKDFRVSRMSDDASYQHVPVVWMTQADAAAAHLVAGGESAGRGTVDARASRSDAAASGAAAPVAASVALLETGAGFDAATLRADAGLVAKSPSDSLSTISSYQAENGSLTLMRVMLMLVSALVVGAFFTVWTIQRTPDLAVLKAIGAKTSYLLRDALAEAGVLLAVGGGLGTLAAVALGFVARSAVPFVLSPTTTLVPLVLLILLGLLGAGVSLRRIVTVDPNAALGAAR